jgi:uncharacterized protein (TIGR02588 family)
MAGRARSSSLKWARRLARRAAEYLRRWSDDGEPARPGHGDQTAGGEARSRRSTAQQVTTAFSVLLIVGLAAAILYEGYAGTSPGAAILEAEVRIDQVEQHGEAYYLPVEVHNRGNRAVEEVLVAIEVYAGDELIEETETVIPRIGEQGSASSTLVLDRDPSSLRIEAAVSTFQESST